MGIIGSTPETGVRIDLSRPREQGPPWHYQGEAVTRDARFPMTAVVTGEGDVEVDLRSSAQAEQGEQTAPTTPGIEATAERVRLLLRAAYKHAQEDGQPPPRRIVRWRAEVRVDGDVAPPRPRG
jgi:hypothetical protein